MAVDHSRRAKFLKYLLAKDPDFPTRFIPPVPGEVYALRHPDHPVAGLVAMLERILFCCGDLTAELVTEEQKLDMQNIVQVSLWARNRFYTVVNHAAPRVAPSQARSLFDEIFGVSSPASAQPVLPPPEKYDPVFIDLKKWNDIKAVLKSNEQARVSPEHGPPFLCEFFPETTFQVLTDRMWVRIFMHVAQKVSNFAGQFSSDNVLGSFVLYGLALRLSQLNNAFAQKHCQPTSSPVASKPASVAAPPPPPTDPQPKKRTAAVENSPSTPNPKRVAVTPDGLVTPIPVRATAPSVGPPQSAPPATGIPSAETKDDINLTHAAFSLTPLSQHAAPQFVRRRGRPPRDALAESPGRQLEAVNAFIYRISDAAKLPSVDALRINKLIAVFPCVAL